jgi:hypothetical protein
MQKPLYRKQIWGQALFGLKRLRPFLSFLIAWSSGSDGRNRRVRCSADPLVQAKTWTQSKGFKTTMCFVFVPIRNNFGLSYAELSNAR